MDGVLRLEVAALAQSRNLQKIQASGGSEVQKYFAGKTVLVTGGTGFLGKQLIEKLLRSCREIKRIYLLIRPKKGKDVSQRLRDLFSETLYDELRKYFQNFETKIMGVEGDTSQIGLALSEKNRKMLANELDVIVHVAANVRFDDPIKNAVLTNTRGTREILFLAAECKNLRAFVHLSTAYAHSPRHECKEDFYPCPISSDLMIELVETTDEEVLQNITPGLIGNWPNTYTFSKALAENQVEKLAVKLNIPTAIVRPSIVIASYREPMPGWIDVSNVFGPSGIPLATGLGVMHSFLADQKCKLDLVPVDMTNNLVIAAAYVLAKNEIQPPRIYNFTSTNKNSLTWGGAREISEKYGKRLVSPMTTWYIFSTMTPNRFIYTILCFLWHTIPAHIIDFGATLMGKEPRFRKLYIKMHKLVNVLAYFNLNEWTYHEENVNHLRNGLCEIDKELFNFDISSYKWVEYVQLWFLGIRKYILKDELKNTELGIRKQFWFRIGHYAVVLLYVYIFWCLLSLLNFMFKFVFDGFCKAF